MQGELKQIQDEGGITFLYVTMTRKRPLTMSNRIAVFNEGRIEQVGTPADLYERRSTPSSPASFGVSNVLEAGWKAIPVARRDQDPRRGPSRRTAPGRARPDSGVAYARDDHPLHVNLNAGGELQVCARTSSGHPPRRWSSAAGEVRVGWRRNRPSN